MRPPTGSVSVLRSQVVIPKGSVLWRNSGQRSRESTVLCFKALGMSLSVYIQASVRIRLKAQVYKVHGILIVHQTLD